MMEGMFKKLFSRAVTPAAPADPVTRAAQRACEGHAMRFLRAEFGRDNLLTLWFELVHNDERWEYGAPVLASLFEGDGEAFVVALLREYLAAARAHIDRHARPRQLTLALPGGRGTLRRG